MGNTHPLVHVFPKQLTTRFKAEEYLSNVKMEHASFLTKWFSYMPFVLSVEDSGGIFVFFIAV